MNAPVFVCELAYSYYKAARREVSAEVLAIYFPITGAAMERRYQQERGPL